MKITLTSRIDITGAPEPLAAENPRHVHDREPQVD